MLVGIHNLSHCSNIIPEAADMWEAGEHFNTVVLCDTSCRTGKLTQTPRNNPRPFTWHHGKISCGCVIPDRYLFNLLLQTTQKPWLHSIRSNLFHASLYYCSAAHGYTTHGWHKYHGHYGQEEVGLSIMAFCIFVSHASWQSLLSQAEQPTSRLPYSQLDQIDLVSLLLSSSASFSWWATSFLEYSA